MMTRWGALALVASLVGCDAEGPSGARLGDGAGRAEAGAPDQAGAGGDGAGGDGAGSADLAGDGSGGDGARGDGPALDAGGDEGPAGDRGAPPDGGGDTPPCVETIRVGDLEVFAFEASRVDADAEGAGVAGPAAGACSRAGVLPWGAVSLEEATAACANLGFHLCSDAEWVLACRGGERGWTYPYGTGHRPGRCNDHISGSGAVERTGGRAECASPEGGFDLSGNLWELNADGLRRGASYQLNAAFFRAEYAGCIDSVVHLEGFVAPDVGFRCCR